MADVDAPVESMESNNDLEMAEVDVADGDDGTGLSQIIPEVPARVTFLE